MLVGRQEGHLACKKYGGWWRRALVSPDGVAPSRMLDVSASVNLPLHHKVQKFSSGTGSPGWSRKKGRKMVVCVCVCVCSVQYCVQQLWTVQCTHTWTNLTVLWIGFCLTGPNSLCLDSFLYFVYHYIACMCRILTQWGGPGGIEAHP